MAKSLYPEMVDINEFDTVVINLDFPSGTIVVIDKSRFSNYGHDQVDSYILYLTILNLNKNSLT